MKYFKFKPLLKTMIWGTESWQISGVPDNETLAEDGRSLNKIVQTEKAALVGESNYRRFGDEFPLLIKFIDARQELSIQVHPNDEVAHRHGKSRGKTEMWYIMDSAPDAKLYNGLRMKITPEQYKQRVADDTICEVLAQYSVKEGDCFFIPAGRIHSIGAGCYLTEIQQTSDVTYRIYDYKRKDKDGNYRQLHTKEAAESINYTVCDDYRTHYTPVKNKSVELVSCPYFTTSLYELDKPVSKNLRHVDSFVVAMVLEGSGVLECMGTSTPLRQGTTVLIPASAPSMKFVPQGSLKVLTSGVF